MAAKNIMRSIAKSGAESRMESGTFISLSIKEKVHDVETIESVMESPTKTKFLRGHLRPQTNIIPKE